MAHRISPADVALLGQLRRRVAVVSLSQGKPTALQTQPPGDEKLGLFSSEMGRFRSQMPLLR